MKHKIILLGLAALSAAMLALPAVASAGEPKVHCGGTGVLCGKFTSHGEHSELRATGEPPITCKKNSGAGEWTSETTGTIELTFHECSTSFFGFPVTCTSTTPAGGSPGTIKTQKNVFHTTYLTAGKTTPGVLVTGPFFTTIDCGSGLDRISVEGNVLGHLTSPACGKSSTSYTLDFEATGSTQKYMQVTGAGTLYDLTALTEPNGSKVTAGMEAEGTMTLAKAGTLTCV